MERFVDTGPSHQICRLNSALPASRQTAQSMHPATATRHEQRPDQARYCQETTKSRFVLRRNRLICLAGRVDSHPCCFHSSVQVFTRSANMACISCKSLTGGKVCAGSNTRLSQTTKARRSSSCSEAVSQLIRGELRHDSLAWLRGWRPDTTVSAHRP